MPKGFSEREKEIIHERLLEQARALLATRGVRKTSVEELTSGVGISKGAFYLFFPSKEELFFMIFEQFEAAYRASLLRFAAAPGATPREQVRAFFRQTFSLWKTSPLFAHFGQADFEYLTRKLPEERMRDHVQRDAIFGSQLLAHWREQGIVIDCDPDLFTGLMRALFFVSLHERDIGSDVYPATIELLIAMIANQLVP